MRLATTRSGIPSPLRSATAREDGSFPAAVVIMGPKVPFPSPRKVPTVSPIPVATLPALPTTRSGMLSPFTSAMTTVWGPRLSTSNGPGLNVPSPLPRNTSTLLDAVALPLSVTTMSGMPSLFRSVIATEVGSTPAANVCIDSKAPPPLPRSTPMVFEPELAITMSGMPSPFRSATARPSGAAPTG